MRCDCGIASRRLCDDPREIGSIGYNANGLAVREPVCVAFERRRPESNRRITVLQTAALPLGYGALGVRNVVCCLNFFKRASPALARVPHGGQKEGLTKQDFLIC